MVALLHFAALGLAAVAGLTDAQPTKDEPRDWSPPAHANDPFKSPFDNKLYLSTIDIDIDNNDRTSYSGGKGHLLFTVNDVKANKSDFPTGVMCRLELDCAAHWNPNSTYPGWVEYNKDRRDIPCLSNHSIWIGAGWFCKPAVDGVSPEAHADREFLAIQFQYRHGKGVQTIVDVKQECELSNMYDLATRKSSAKCQLGTNLKPWSEKEGFDGTHGHSS